MLLAIHYGNNNEWDTVKQLFVQRPDWAETVAGAEIAARAALVAGQIEQAKQIYIDIQDESTESKLFLSRLAFQAKDWEQARELTEALIQSNPDEPAFYANLQAINEAEARQ